MCSFVFSSCYRPVVALLWLWEWLPWFQSHTLLMTNNPSFIEKKRHGELWQSSLLLMDSLMSLAVLTWSSSFKRPLGDKVSTCSARTPASFEGRCVISDCVGCTNRDATTSFNPIIATEAAPWASTVYSSRASDKIKFSIWVYNSPVSTLGLKLDPDLNHSTPITSFQNKRLVGTLGFRLFLLVFVLFLKRERSQPSLTWMQHLLVQGAWMMSPPVTMTQRYRWIRWVWFLV